ncbi:MAG: hypothetical protein HUJ56_07150, partial [Erysipelotrichaceae bacterium]|nr:hypothetical protein [Erysipelotrichaceae bacterium]
AAINALKEYVGIDGEMSARQLRAHRTEIFDIIEEVVDEVVPAKLTDILGVTAEVKSFGRDQEVKFTIEGVGSQRIKAAIVPGARGGIYRARRLDTKDLYIPTHVETIGYATTLEEILLGSMNVAKIVQIIAEGLAEKVWCEVVKSLRALYATLPANNKAASTSAMVDFAGIDKVVRTISTYGRPVLIGFSKITYQLFNYVGNTEINRIPTMDADEIRNSGRVSMYKGNVVITLPNYFLDESNTQWIFKETDMFILPAGIRPVKVAFQGDAYTSEVQQPHGGTEWHLHKMMGVGILFNQSVGMYRIVDATDQGLY